jgi:hypothetical protein
MAASDHNLRTATVNLSEKASEPVDEGMAAVREERDAIISEAVDRVGPNPTPSDLPADLQQRWAAVQATEERLQQRAETFRHYADDWTEGDEEADIVVHELTAAEYTAAADEAAAARQSLDGDSDRRNLARLKVVEQAVDEVPSGAPADPGKWPGAVFEAVHAAIDQIGTPAGSGDDMELSPGNSLAAAVSDSTTGGE